MTDPYLSKPIRTISGTVTISQQLYDQTVKAEREFTELEWIATHYSEATPEQQARFDRFQAAADAYENDWPAPIARKLRAQA